jgi:hypothetical protein
MFSIARRWGGVGQTPPTLPGGRETQARRRPGTVGGEGGAPLWSSPAAVAVVCIIVTHHYPTPLQLPPSLSMTRSPSASRATAYRAITMVVDYYLVLHSPPPPTSWWQRQIRGGGIVKKGKKLSVFMSHKNQKSCHQYEGPVVQAWLPSHFTAPSHCFTSLGGQLIGVRSVMVGWSMRTVCYQICML